MKPTINAAPPSGTGYDRKEMLIRLYNKLNTVAYKANKTQAVGYSKETVVYFIRKVQELISDVIEERPIDKADFKEVSLMELLLEEGKETT